MTADGRGWARIRNDPGRHGGQTTDGADDIPIESSDHSTHLVEGELGWDKDALTVRRSNGTDFEVDKGNLPGLLVTLAQSINYSRFKDCIARHPDQRPKLTAYHGFWGAMLEVQHLATDPAEL